MAEHYRISRDTIFPPSISNMWSSVIGLPGKLPDTVTRSRRAFLDADRGSRLRAV
jgi:hypothetical protein